MQFRSPLVIALTAALGLALAGGGAAFAVGKSSSKSTGSTSTGTQSSTTSTQSTPQQSCPGFGPGPGRRLGLPGLPPSLGAAANYLGLTTQQLFSRLMNGQSLADIAKAQGKSVSGLEDAIVNGAAERLQQAVDAGRITAQQRTEILSTIRDHVDELVNRTPPRLRTRPGFGAPPPMWRDHDDDHWRNSGNGSSGNASYGPAAAGAWA